MRHAFEDYAPFKKGAIDKRMQGVLVSKQVGSVGAFSLFNWQARGKLIIGPQIDVYEGMVIGIHSRDNDPVVNVTKAKQLTNVRAAGTGEHIILIPPVQFSLEHALEFINDDELVEVTPKNIRICKKLLKENERKTNVFKEAICCNTFD
jgi:GTP-binding protein